MNAQRIDGKALAQEIILNLSTKATHSQKRVCFIILHSTPATETFVKMKMNIAAQIGIAADVLRYNARNNEGAMRYIQEIVSRKYDGLVVQLPLSSESQTEEILNSIPVEQDIDMLSSASKELFLKKQTTRIPPVAFAVWSVLEKNTIDLQNKKILIVGKGKLVGEPVCKLFESKDIAYDVIDKDTAIEIQTNLLKEADIIISGIGVPGHIKADMIKEGVVLIDAGTSEQAGKMVGDIDPECYEKASLYTPVPGGIGPLTVAGLFWNVFQK